MADKCRTQEDLAALDSRSPATRQKRPYNRWSDEAKQRLLSLREEYPELSWPKFQEKFYPGSNFKTLQKTHSEIKRNFQPKSEMSTVVQTRQVTFSEPPKSIPSKRNRGEEAASDCNSSGEDIPYSEPPRSPKMMSRVHKVQRSLDPRYKLGKPSGQQSTIPQNENGPTNTPNTPRKAGSPLCSTSPQVSDVSGTTPLEGNQENSNKQRAQAFGSPQKSQYIQKDIETYDLPPEIQQPLNKLFIQASAEQRNMYLQELSQMRQDLTSKSDQLRVSEEKNLGLEAEVLRLKKEIESVQASEKSLRDELQIKCDELGRMISNVIKVVQP